jgi:hypothetical protein
MLALQLKALKNTTVALTLMVMALKTKKTNVQMLLDLKMEKAALIQMAMVFMTTETFVQMLLV